MDSGSIRALLGMSILLMLLPAFSFALTGEFDNWIPGVDTQRTSAAMDAPEMANRIALDKALGTLSATQDDRSVTGETGQDPRAGSGSTHHAATDHGHGETAGEGADAAGDVGPSNEDASATTSATARTAPTATSDTSAGQSDDGGGKETGGTITGNACPCTVTGTAELKGTVNLEGDIMVQGGTLIARSGLTVNGNGFQIMFMNGGTADFQGTKTSTWSGTGTSANLSRDITFKDLRRIMFHERAGKSTLSYFTVVDSGGPNMGDYPLHWHLNGDSTRGTVVEGVAVIRGRHHAFVPHGSHGITFRDTIAKDTRGAPYWWDPPGTNESCKFIKYCSLDNSYDIVYDHALADGVTNGPGDDRGYTLTGFVLGGGRHNVIRNSSAINVNPTHPKNCSGYHWPAGADTNDSTSWVFQNNHGSSKCHGIYVWQNDDRFHLVDGFTGGGINHGAYGNKYHYKNVDVPYMRVTAVGWTAENSHLGDVTLVDHTFTGDVVWTNVTMDSLTISDGGKDGSVTLKINGTNISCEDIALEDPHPDTRVVIDSSTC